VKTEQQKERDRLSSREAKRRRTGICEVCGEMTRYNGHGRRPRDVSRICYICSARRNAAAQRGTGSHGAAVLKHLRRVRVARAVELTHEFGVSSQQTHVLLRRLMNYGLVERRARGWYALKSEEAP